MIVDAVEIVSEAGGQAAALNFASGAPTVTVTFDAASATRLAPLLAAAGMNITQAQNTVAGLVVTQLQTSVGRVLLTPFIPVTNDTDPTTIFDLDVTTVNDTSSADRDCMAFGVRMDNQTGGNINNVTTNLIPAGGTSLVMMSNTWLLAKVMRPKVASALGVPVSDFDTPLHLNQSITAPGGQGTLTNLDAFIQGNRIQIDGRATASGTGWSAVSTFTFFVSLSIDATGSIAISTTTPTVHTDVDLEWWVWLVGLGLGALFGGIIGVIVAAVLLAITQSVVDGVADGLISSGISSSLGSFSVDPPGPDRQRPGDDVARARRPRAARVHRPSHHGARPQQRHPQHGRRPVLRPRRRDVVGHAVAGHRSRVGSGDGADHARRGPPVDHRSDLRVPRSAGHLAAGPRQHPRAAVDDPDVPRTSASSPAAAGSSSGPAPRRADSRSVEPGSMRSRSSSCSSG